MFKTLDFIRSKNQSFTLIELLTSITLFTFLIMAAIGIYLTSITRHQQALRSQVVNEDLQYATEIMARDIRDSYIVGWSDTDGDSSTTEIIYLNHPTKNIVTGVCDPMNPSPLSCEGCNLSTIPSQKPACACCLQYYFNSDPSALPNIGRIEIRDKYNDCTFDNDCPSLTSSRVDIEYLDFILDDIRDPVSNPGTWQEDQPRVTIVIRAREKDDSLDTSDIRLQLTITQMEVLHFFQGEISLPL